MTLSRGLDPATSTDTQHDGQTTWSDPAVLAAAFLLYTVLTIWLTWPLALHLRDRLANDAGDPALNAWLLWWNATTRPLTEAWWNGLGFWPTKGTIAFSEHLLGLGWLTSPIIWLGGTPALAYNIAFLASFVLSAFGAHLLAWRLTGRHDAGLVAGLAFGFAPVRAGHLSHLQVLSAYWMPIALLALHEFWRTRHAKWLALFALAWLLQALSNNYYALFSSALVGLWLAWFGLTRGALGRLVAAAGVSMAAAVCLIPLAIGYRATHAENGLRRGLDEVAIFSADLAAFFNAPRLLWLWGWLQTEIWPERELFGGVTAILVLVALAVVRARRRESRAVNDAPMPPSPRWLRTLRLALFAAGAVAALAAIWVWTGLPGGAVLRALGISTRHPHKTMTVAVVLVLAGVTLLPAVWRHVRHRSVFGFYVTAWLTCLMWSLGPELRVFDTKILYRTPYALLYEFVPGFEGIRAPSRFTVLAALCLSVAAAIAFARLIERDARSRRFVLGVVALALVLEGSLRRLPLASVPEPVPQLATADGIVMELPLGEAFGEAAALYRSSAHGHRLANGYSGYEPLFYRALRDGLALHDVAALSEVTRLTPVTVLIDRTHDPDGQWRRFVDQLAARVVVDGPRFSVLYCPRTTAAAPVSDPLPVAHGAAVAIAGVTATTQVEQARALTDGDGQTGWGTSGPQKAGDEIVADLGRVQSVGGIEMDQGPWPADVPRQLEIAVSSGGNEWRVVWSGTTAVQTMRAALRNPLDVHLSMTFPAAAARYVRLRQTAGAATVAWNVAELRVLGAPAPQTAVD